MQSPTGGTRGDTLATSAITVRHEALKLDFNFLCLVANIDAKKKNKKLHPRPAAIVCNSLYLHPKNAVFSLLCKCIPLRRQIFTAITACFEGEKQICLFLASYHQIRKQPPHPPPPPPSPIFFSSGTNVPGLRLSPRGTLCSTQFTA